ncbi:MAG: hypothetical protein NT069_22670 [Planctomycetota bacterium]|nr:hypothetical protein [Planctomycetota bacterium]
MLSVNFRWGWLVPCVIGGILVGMVPDSVGTGAPGDVVIWEMAIGMGKGAVVGLALGLVLDANFPALAGDNHTQSDLPSAAASLETVGSIDLGVHGGTPTVTQAGEVAATGTATDATDRKPEPTP